MWIYQEKESQRMWRLERLLFFFKSQWGFTLVIFLILMILILFFVKRKMNKGS